MPLLPWLVALDAAGHLDAYDHWLYGPAFPDEMKRWGDAHRGGDRRDGEVGDGPPAVLEVTTAAVRAAG